MSIKKQEFSKSVRGYNRDEVLAFLDKLSDEFETLQQENEQLKRDIQRLKVLEIELEKRERTLR